MQRLFNWRRTVFALALLTAVVLAGGLAVTRASSAASPVTSHVRGRVRIWLIHYRAHNGAVRLAYLDLPRWYGPGDHPPLPLVISPHGRGSTPAANSALWGNLPELGRFAVVNPQGQGRRLVLYSWGDRGQIADLALMPLLVRRALPWLRIDSRRIYAVGASMGGQEALLLLARYPHLLAGVAAFDPPTDLGRRYADFRLLQCTPGCRRRWPERFDHGTFGEQVQALARFEIGGTPATVPGAYAARSPLAYARALAFADVPLQIWWSRADNVVVDQRHQSGLLYRRIKRLNPAAPVQQFVGDWPHASEMTVQTKLPTALIKLGLLSPGSAPARHSSPPAASVPPCRCR